MSEVRVPVRVLQSGKVYRQMFDAEVQLMKSFDATRNKAQHGTEKLTGDRFYLPELSTKHTGPQNDIKSSNLTAANILTERQKTWTDGMPNDSVTENPVVYRQITTEAALRLQETETDHEVRDVRGLPNIVQITKKDSNIIERISEKRKERHERALEEMHHDLSMISNRVEPRITSIGENLQKQLKDDDITIENIFSEIASNDDLVNFSYDQLEDVWTRIESHSSVRREWIKNSTEWFNQVEDERLEAISGVFRKYTIKLEKVASLPGADIHRLIEKEAMMINQSILANRRAFAKLHTNLLESDIEREITQHRTWSERVKDWRKLNAEVAVKQFTDFMQSESILNPPDVNMVMETLLREQKQLSEKRCAIMEQLKELKPPSSTKPSVYKWNTALTKAHEDIDKLHLKLVRSLHEKYEKTCQACLSEIEKYKQNLLISKVCDEDDMRRIVNDHLLPQVGNRLRVFEKTLEKMDQMLEELAMRTEQQLKRLFKFAQGAAHLWDVHEIGLAKQERKLQNELEQTRQFHDADNQDRESKLDIALDRLRQESTDDALTLCLDQCMDMLVHIKEGYEEFHVEQLNKVSQYPGMVEEELLRYDASVCKFFSVDRNKPEPEPPKKRLPKGKKDKKEKDSVKEKKEKESVKEKKEKDSVKDKKEVSVKGNIGKLKGLTRPQQDEQSKSGQKQKKEAKGKKKKDQPKKEETEEVETEIDKVVREILTTEQGTPFYVLTITDKEDFDGLVESKADDGGVEESAFLTEIVSNDLESLPEYIRNVYIDSAYVKDLKTHVRMCFLNHLEQWRERAFHNAEVSAKNKSEELASELDLRLHLHAPRSKRIEVDVRNVRAAELVLHKERVGRHCRGITAALASLKHDFSEMTKTHDEQAADFRSSVEAMEDVYTSATKSTKLVEQTNSLHADLASYVENIKVSLRGFRQSLDTTLGRLRESNAQCVRSFKLFCEGGNFSPEETIPLRKKLEKMSQKVDAAEGAVMRDLEGMESRRLEQATEFVNRFEDRFRNHLIDLTFVEGMHRWLTNSQARIKTEVAHSNGLATEVASHLSNLRRRIDACERPNIDKEHVTPDLLHAYIHDIMDCLHKRATYLNCNKPTHVLNPESQLDSHTASTSDMNVPPTSAGVKQATLSAGPKARGASAKSGTRGTSAKSGTRGLSTAQKGASRQGLDTQGTSYSRGRQPTEDAAIGVIKNILRAQKGTSADIDDTRSIATGTSRPPLSTSNSQTATGGRQHRGYQRQTTLASIAGSVTDSDTGKKATPENVASAVYKRRETKFEAKYMIFGSKPLEGSHFMAKVHQILHKALDGMLSTAEIYYKQKGSRLPTRPQLIQDNFEQCADAVVDKLQNYRQQSEEFHNKSLQDFRQLLRDLEHELCHVPDLILKDLLKQELETLGGGQDKLEEKYKQQEEEWDRQKKSHKHELRPTLGHPDQQPALNELSERENKRQDQHVKGIEEHTHAMEDNVRECALSFINKLSAVSCGLLEEFDDLLTIDDVVVGRVPPRKELTSILMRRRQAGFDMAVVADPSFGEKPIVERGPRQWVVCDANVLELPARDDALSIEVTEPVHTTSTTLPHTKVASKRDDVLRAYRDAHVNALASMREKMSVRQQGESRWKSNWNESLTNVKSLYR